MPTKSKKYKISKKGALRVQSLTYRDSGVYTCIAGRSKADLTLSVRPKPGEFLNSEEIQKQVGYKNERVDLQVAGIQAGEEAGNTIFSDDHSHEQRPDSAKKTVNQNGKLYTPARSSPKTEINIYKTEAWPSKSTTQRSDQEAVRQYIIFIIS